MWCKNGVLLNINMLQQDWIKSHLQLPMVYCKTPDVLRVYFSVRNMKMCSLPMYADYNVKDMSIITINDTNPLLTLGETGTFDDKGIVFSSAVSFKGKIYMYYVGWNQRKELPYSLSIGLAVSNDNGDTFNKASDGPVLDRDYECPFFNTAPFVVNENGLLKMWYVYCTGWQYNEKDGWVPAYYIKNAISKDGIHWQRRNEICINYRTIHEAIARPCVRFINGRYYMWYSYRDTRDFRHNRDNAYMIGVATSEDGLNWTRQDDRVGIEKSAEGWDSEMMCYPYVFELNGKLIMLYNGNEHGKYAFGWATREIDDLEKSLR